MAGSINTLQPIREPRREDSPARYLALLSTVTGMQSLGDLQNGVLGKTTGDSELAKIRGLIVVGSCTDPTSKPKDIDVIILSKIGLNSFTFDYIDYIKTVFDQGVTRLLLESGIASFTIGALDVLGCIDGKFKSDNPLVPSTISYTKDPIVYAFNLMEAKTIAQQVATLKKQ